MICEDLDLTILKSSRASHASYRDGGITVLPKNKREFISIKVILTIKFTHSQG